MIMLLIFFIIILDFWFIKGVFIVIINYIYVWLKIKK
jgi:hypothetical protein